MLRLPFLLLLLHMALAAPGEHYVMRSFPFDIDSLQDMFRVFMKRSGGSCPSNSGSSKLSGTEKKAYVKAHNDLRKKEGANLPDMVWDETLAVQSQKLADAQSNCDMQHKLMTCGNNRVGQNLAWDWSSATQNGNMPPEKVVQMWYDEKSDYDLGSKKCHPGKVCGHYTQVVWRGTTKVGCAARNCGNARLAVCDYFPAGNWQGKGPHDEKNTF